MAKRPGRVQTGMMLRTLIRRNRTTLLGALALMLPLAVMGARDEAGDAPASADARAELHRQLVDQHRFGDMACGPCAMYHALLFGGPEARRVLAALPGATPEERVDQLIRTYGSRRSTMRFGEPVLHARGLHWQDAGSWMHDMVRDHGGPALADGYLQREPDDDPMTHLRKVHDLLAASLEAGWPPVISLRGYSARFDNLRGTVAWEAGRSHYVTLIGIGGLEQPEDSGFVFRYIDPSGAQQRQGFIHIERQRDFQAQTTNEPLGVWVGDAPFLTVTVPFLRLIEQEVPPHLRTVVTLHHAIVFNGD